VRVLVLNSGSSSLKYKVVDTARRRALRTGTVERLAGDDAGPAVRAVLAEVGDLEVEAVGHRVVHGGERFHAPALVDGEIEAAIADCCVLAPAHNPRNLAGIRAAREALPDVPHVAVFDTAFHWSLPRRASTYAIDAGLAAELGLRRYGFHGTSHAFVAEEAAAALRTPLEQLRLVTLHLGNGASACAVEYGKSTETSMGLTPLEGLVMGSRSGDVDPGVVLALLRSGRSVDEVEGVLGARSGLAGVSGVGNDLRDLEERAAHGHDGARLAISVFAHRARKYVGAYAAAMAGLDAVVLTGGIGERSVAMRRRVLQRFEFLGLHLDEERNADARVSDEGPRVAEISAGHSRVRALVVATDEELRIAEQTAKVVAGLTAVGSPAPIPVAINSRHVHLDDEALAALFGEGVELTPRRELTASGQFLCAETVDLIGPRSAIEDVPVVGPLRPQPQVEIGRRDEYRLGVDAPVRSSGNLAGSAPITLRGPAGRVDLREGLIQPRRHVHMTPEGAVRYAVEDGDEVALDVVGGPRPVTYRDVLVRVEPDARLELHVDPDDAELADLEPVADYLDVVPGARARLVSRRPTRVLRRRSLEGLAGPGDG